MEAEAQYPKSSGRKGLLKFLLKVLISGVALFFVFRKVDFGASWQAILDTHPGWFALAVVWFNLIKVFSVLRLQYFARPLGAEIPFWWNVRLYFIGAFYNLFLPGSIGGDGYKVWLLKQRYGEAKTRLLISLIFLDRVSGMAALFTLTCAMVLLSGYPPDLWWLGWLAIGGLLLCYPLYYIFLAKLFPLFKGAYWITNGVSLVLQLGMVLFAWFILKALGVTELHFTYIVVFMIASVISIIPFTLGGLGARETVFTMAAALVPIDETKGVAMAMLVFTVLAFSSFFGMILNFTGRDS